MVMSAHDRPGQVTHEYRYRKIRIQRHERLVGVTRWMTRQKMPRCNLVHEIIDTQEPINTVTQ